MRTADRLLQFASEFPKLEIGVNGRPYLDRYYVRGAHPSSGFGIKDPPSLPDTLLPGIPDPTIYLHHFHAGDGDRDLHNHPWSARCLILCGGYREEYLEGGEILTREFRAGQVNAFGPRHFHRIDLLEPDTWTLVIHGAPTQPWGFRDNVTGVFVGWREYLARKP